MGSKRTIVTNIAHEVEDYPSRIEIKRAIIESLTELTRAQIEEGVLTKEEAGTSQTLYQTHYKQASWNMGTPVHE